MNKKLNFIFLNGQMGSGKSTITNLLRKNLKRTALLSIEDIRVLLSDFRPSTEDHLLAWKIIYRMCDEYFKNGISVLLEQIVCSEEVVNKFLRLAKKHKCVIGFYHLQATRNILLSRIEKREKDQKPAKNAILKNINKHEKMIYPKAAIIDTSEVSPSEVAKLILNNSKPRVL
ncbi:hypothetical protein A3F97_02970 [Candidatus Nomurabacteria bacterium RIFCSPLOWO2_12_FULL_41_10]|uniref:UDP-N-acetylglucosamine kinase n=1 Tax=Candidatus Nomurabacteria bacterium RIFCSPLOWO2_12_FULL_41_10 TaxID=1801795 RepID=A0A1F6YDJ6_9BACT|nr:MAG: hypothetical protein A3F97_02970 [Candidatus Nomurabacteria bacterium RIFCSPLOWO2_12_FULL_41_10]